MEIDEVTELLTSSVVPSFAAELDKMPKKEKMGFLLLSAIHQKGKIFFARQMSYIYTYIISFDLEKDLTQRKTTL